MQYGEMWGQMCASDRSTLSEHIKYFHTWTPENVQPFNIRRAQQEIIQVRRVHSNRNISNRRWPLSPKALKPHCLSKLTSSSVSLTRFRWKGSKTEVCHLSRVCWRVLELKDTHCSPYLLAFLFASYVNSMNCCFLYPRIGPLYLNTLYLHQVWALSMQAAMVFTVMQTGEINTFWVFMTT